MSANSDREVPRGGANSVLQEHVPAAGNAPANERCRRRSRKRVSPPVLQPGMSPPVAVWPSFVRPAAAAPMRPPLVSPGTGPPDEFADHFLAGSMYVCKMDTHIYVIRVRKIYTHSRYCPTPRAMRGSLSPLSRLLCKISKKGTARQGPMDIARAKQTLAPALMPIRESLELITPFGPAKPDYRSFFVHRNLRNPLRKSTRIYLATGPVAQRMSTVSGLEASGP
ncbi:unnamed protein product [Trichogramma brassicae]|uniref:Uncharacterized protein n=1 Tax=Trichogramma brassicae TaxID=86971 RepID=A0A6H5I106_9HYME|nr:unnamed protein product [Trichogramma brassicae]